MNNREKGNLGEEQALQYLLKKGYKLIDKNWHYSRNAELDLIMQDGKTLVFVEVKKRSNLNYGHPFEAITPNKIKNIKLAANAYLSTQTHKLSTKNFRIDGIAIVQNPFSIEHLENIY